MSDILAQLESIEGVERRRGETTREFIQRLASDTGFDGDTRAVVEAIETQQFTPDATVSEKQIAAAKEFLEATKADSGETRDSPNHQASEVSSGASTEAVVSELSSTDSPHDNHQVATNISSEDQTERDTDVPALASVLSHSTDEVGSSKIIQLLERKRWTREGLHHHRMGNLQRSIQTSLAGLWTAIANHRALTALVALALYLTLHNLGVYPLSTWDEAIYGNVARNMLQDGHWLSPTVQWGGYNDRLFFEKPPGAFWLQAVAMMLFGVSEFAVRLPSALAAVGTLILTYRFGRQLFNRRVGLFAAGIWLFTPFVLFGANAARTGGTDTLTTFFGTLFVYQTWQLVSGHNGPKQYAFIGAAAGALLMIKGFAAGTFVLVVAPLVVIEWRRFFTQEFVLTISATATISIPWAAYAYIRHGSEFVDQIFIQQVLSRATGGAFVEFEGMFGFMRFPYILGLFTFFDPWVFWLIPATAYLINQEAYKKHSYKNLIIIWWFIIIVGFYSLTGNHGWYILPSYVPGALLIGKLYADTSGGNRVASVTTIVGTALTLIFSTRLNGISPFAVSKPTYNGRVLDILTPYPDGVLFASAILVVSAVVVLYSDIDRYISTLRQSDAKLAKGAILCGMLVLLTVSMIGATPPMVNDSGKDIQEKALGHEIQQRTVSTEKIYLQEAVRSETGPKTTLAFYAERDIILQKLNEIESDSSVRYAILSGNSLDQLEREHEVLSTKEGGKVVFVKFID